MKIHEVTITVERAELAAAFYRDVLELPVRTEGERVTVMIGSSRLVLERGDRFTGVHHLAIGIAPADFDRARAWLGRRTELLTVDGSTVIVGPDGWDSRSVYFLGPDSVVLEYIARQADAHLSPGAGLAPRPLALSEVGIGVPDVGEAVSALERVLGLPRFPPQESHFAPVGDHDGLIILVDQERVWFPTRLQRAARGPAAVRIDAPHPGLVSLRTSAHVVAEA